MTVPEVPGSGVFLDTSGLYAALDRGAERHHAVAAELERLMRSGLRLVVSDAIVTEFHGLALGRLGPTFALEAVDRLLASPRVTIVPTGPAAVLAGVELLRSRTGRRLSLADAMSFGIMRIEGLEFALTLDDDFAAEGFRMVPAPQP